MLPQSLTSVTAQANDRFAYREALSWFEKPLAVEIGDVTLQLRGSLEQAAVADLNADTVTAKTSGVLHFSAETQLRNQLTIGAQYSAGYDTEPGSITDVGGVALSLLADTVVCVLAHTTTLPSSCTNAASESGSIYP